MKRLFLMAVTAMLLLASCQRGQHFITDRAYRSEVHADFEARMAEFPMLKVQLDTLCRAEREAMEFLYAYMPLSDLADYTPQFFLQQVRYAFKARAEMPWGKDVPEDTEFDTIGGFVVDLLGHFPTQSENASVRWEDIEFTVLEVDENRIEKLRAVKKEKAQN